MINHCGVVWQNRKVTKKIEPTRSTLFVQNEIHLKIYSAILFLIAILVLGPLLLYSLCEHKNG